jgi:electron-transferring-flavoprotein dehydrogenase
VEKGSEIGAHILSGAVIEPRALTELIPDWKEKGAPLNNPVTEDDVYYLIDEKQGMRIPGIAIPQALHNPTESHATSLGNLCRWLGEQAEELGIMLFPGFAASEVLYNEDGSIKALLPVTWVSAHQVSRKVLSRLVTNCMPNTRYSPRVVAATWVNR